MITIKRVKQQPQSKQPQPVIPSSAVEAGLESRRQQIRQPRASEALSWDLERDGVTQGLLARFLACPEKHRLAMEEMLSPERQAPAMAFGSVFHVLLESYYKRNPDHSPGYQPIKLLISTQEDAYWREQHRDLISPEEWEKLEETWGLAAILMTAYDKRWNKEDQRKEWVSLEERFEQLYNLRIYHPGIQDWMPYEIKIRGKFDGIYKAGGKLWLLETKTKGRIEEEQLSERLAFDLQVMLYIWAASQRYEVIPQGVLYNVVRRPQLQRSKKENLKQFLERVEKDVYSRPDFYFVRMECVIDTDEWNRWMMEFSEMLAQLVDHTEGRGHHYRNPTACVGRAGTCEFLPTCSRGSRDHLVRRESVFPELDEE